MKLEHKFEMVLTVFSILSFLIASFFISLVIYYRFYDKSGHKKENIAKKVLLTETFINLYYQETGRYPDKVEDFKEIDIDYKKYTFDNKAQVVFIADSDTIEIHYAMEDIICIYKGINRKK